MENEILKRLDQMIMRHELLLANAGDRRSLSPAALRTQIEHLETGLYALREGVHGFMKAKECGLPLENLDGYIGALEAVADKAEQSLLDAIAKLEVTKATGHPG